MIEELIYNKLILNYHISGQFICIQTGGVVEVRERGNWTKLVCTHALGEGQGTVGVFVEGEHLFVEVEGQGLKF